MFAYVFDIVHVQAISDEVFSGHRVYLLATGQVVTHVPSIQTEKWTHRVKCIMSLKTIKHEILDLLGTWDPSIAQTVSWNHFQI